MAKWFNAAFQFLIGNHEESIGDCGMRGPANHKASFTHFRQDDIHLLPKQLAYLDCAQDMHP